MRTRMDPFTIKPISERSCLRHGRRALMAAGCVSDAQLMASLTVEQGAWMARYELTVASRESEGDPDAPAWITASPPGAPRR